MGENVLSDDGKKLQIIIPPHHQSAPKEHWADKDIKEAAREIDEGNWIPDPDDERDRALAGLGIALGLGENGVAVGKKPAFEEFEHTRNFDLIGRHPRVLEALSKMREEIYSPDDPTKAIENNLAMHELNEASSQRDKWDGQGRWEGHENEEMRYGEILTPQKFYDRLGKVVGKGRIKLGDHMVRESPDAKSGRIGIFVRNPLFKPGSAVAYGPTKQDQARDLRQKGIKIFTESQRLRKAGQHDEATRKVDLAGEMAQEAMRLLSEDATEVLNAQPEMIRVGVLQWPLGTEWMIMSFTEYGAVFAPKFLGWRTALLTMIRAGVITEKEAHKAFPVPSGPAAAWYLEQLMMMRNVEGSVQ